MSAAVQAVLVETLPLLEVETPPRLEAHITPLPAEETVRDLVHELRQPLSSIEAIAYYLEMTLPAEQFQARQYMRRIQMLVDEASLTLNSAVSLMRKPCGSATV
jgi:nitrogen-specific signal transduction histidine kinase